MATKAPLASLYAEGPEDQALVDEIRGSYAKLREALDARQNPLFDPTLLAMAQGFLSPTKTGSFGEALGNVAAQVGPVQEAEDKRSRENAMMKMELAQQELGQRQATRTDTMFRNMIGKNVPSGLPSAGAPTAPGVSIAPGAESVSPEGTAPSGRAITSADIARLASMPGGTEKAKILSDMVKNDRDRFAISMNGIVFDRDTQKYLNLEIPGQKQEPFTTPYGRYEMTPGEYSQFKQAEAAGKGKDWISNFQKPGGMSISPSASSAPGRQTVAEQNAEAEAAKTKAVETAKGEVGRTQDVINSGKDATGRMAAYSSLRSIASRPDANQIFGIFNRPDLATAVLNLVQEGVKSPGSSIQAGALEDTLRNIGLPQDQIDRYRTALATMANIQLQQAKLAAGQGAVSNFERDLFANATISPKDNPATILAKLSMLEARANFDKKMASALRRSKMQADDFMESKDYENLVQDYMNNIYGISQNLGGKAPAKAPAAGQYRIIGVERQ